MDPEQAEVRGPRQSSASFGGEISQGPQRGV